jgi:hypothetical protein
VKTPTSRGALLMLHIASSFEAMKHEIYFTKPLKTDVLSLKMLCFFKQFLPIIIAVHGNVLEGPSD